MTFVISGEFVGNVPKVEVLKNSMALSGGAIPFLFLPTKVWLTTASCDPTPAKLYCPLIITLPIKSASTGPKAIRLAPSNVLSEIVPSRNFVLWPLSSTLACNREFLIVYRMLFVKEIAASPLFDSTMMLSIVSN